jgi:hypothetical protein
MTWTYTPDFTVTRDKIRLAIGDTVDKGVFSLSDEEIVYIAALQPVLGYAAAACARTLAAKYVTQADTENDELKVWASQRFAQLSKLADRLEKNPNLFSGKTRPSPIPFFGGVRESENRALDTTEFRQQWFRNERFDHPEASAGGEGGDLTQGVPSIADPIPNNPTPVYWGVGAAAGSGEAFVLALANTEITTTRAKTFSITAGGAEKIYYAIPTAFGTPTFQIGAFPGGFSLGDSPVVNGDSYTLWESDNLGLGAVTVVVT